MKHVVIHVVDEKYDELVLRLTEIGVTTSQPQENPTIPEWQQTMILGRLENLDDTKLLTWEEIEKDLDND